MTRARLSAALDEVEIERATSPVRLLPGEGLPPTPAPQQLRPAYFPGHPRGAAPVTPAPYTSYQQATPSPYHAPTPAPYVAQHAVPAVPYAVSPAPYVEKPPAYPAPYSAPTPAPYVKASPAPYFSNFAPYVAATPAPYVEAAPATYVAAAPAPYVAAAPALYVAATPAPYAAAPVFYPQDPASYSTIVNFGPQQQEVALGSAHPPPPPPPPAPHSAPSFGLGGPELTLLLPRDIDAGQHSSVQAGGAGNYVFFSLNHEKLQ